MKIAINRELYNHKIYNLLQVEIEEIVISYILSNQELAVAEKLLSVKESSYVNSNEALEFAEVKIATNAYPQQE